MIACLYGRPFAPFVDPVVRDLSDAAAQAGSEIIPITIEDAMAHPGRFADVERLYVLPFDAPPGAQPATLVADLFPKAESMVSFTVQDLCWDKFATQERLAARGLPMPATLVTADPTELRDFVKRHEYVILKERFACGGQSDLVLWLEDGEVYGDCASHRYRMQFTDGGPRRLDGEVMRYPAPFHAQRMVGTVQARRFTPGQTLRAYIINNEVRFWTERYREHYTRPSDWIVDVGLGARYRFVLNISEETRKLALRAAEVVGARIAVVDLVRTSSQGSMVLEVTTDGHHMLIDRQFKQIPEYRDFFDLDRYIARAIIKPADPIDVRVLYTRRDRRS